MSLTTPAAPLAHPAPAHAPGDRPADPGTRPPPTIEAAALALFDQAHAAFTSGDAQAALRRLLPPLSALWTEARSLGAAPAVLSLARRHPLHALLQQDPFTHRATTKPRGYAGDAVMMDQIYAAVPPPGTSALGQSLFAATTRASMSLSVRWRRQLLRSLIDETAVSVDGARMLSVASGHCRELDGSAVQAPWFRGEFLALDQDLLSCDEVRASQAAHPVRVLPQGVRDLLSPGRAEALGTFDLIYSAGLYDYLPDALAQRLTARLSSLLRPGGRLVIANFLPDASARGYMEVFMDWVLVLRTPTEMALLMDAAGPGAISTYVDPHRNVVYAELQRGGRAGG